MAKTSLTERLVSLAAQMELDPVSTIALPATVQSCARKVNLTDAAFLVEAANNEPVRAYMKSIIEGLDPATILREAGV